MFSLEFTPVKFQNWYHLHKDWVASQHLATHGIPQSKERSCFACDGDGYHECDMGHSHDCGNCDGTGKIVKETDEVLEEYGRTLYNAQVKSDHEKVAKFLKEQEHVR
jgi:hypothetical protein